MLEYIKNIFSRRGSIKNMTAPTWQIDIIKSVSNYTMTSTKSLLSLINSIQYIVENKIAGDIVECGVWKGGSMMAAAKTLSYLGHQDRRLYLYDTFENFSKPEAIDISHDGKHGEDVLASLSDDGISWKAPDINTVKKNMSTTGYPENLLEFVKGEVEKTIPGNIPQHIALLRLDTDWYLSTKHELEWLYPNLSKGGVLILDDYGYWKGCRKAVDEYFSRHGIKTRMKEIDFSARFIIKE